MLIPSCAVSSLLDFKICFEGVYEIPLKLLRSVSLAVPSLDFVVVSCSLARTLGKNDSNFFFLSIHRISCFKSYFTV